MILSKSDFLNFFYFWFRKAKFVGSKKAMRVTMTVILRMTTIQIGPQSWVKNFWLVKTDYLRGRAV